MHVTINNVKRIPVDRTSGRSGNTKSDSYGDCTGAWIGVRVNYGLIEPKKLKRDIKSRFRPRHNTTAKKTRLFIIKYNMYTRLLQPCNTFLFSLSGFFFILQNRYCIHRNIVLF